MLTKEQEILAAIKEVEVERRDARNKVDSLKKSLLDAESDLIAANLHLERLKEELRVVRMTTPKHEMSQREKDIEEFRSKMEDFKKRGLL